MALSGDARTRAYVDPDAFGVSHVEPPYAYRCPSAARARTNAASERRRPSPSASITWAGSASRQWSWNQCGLERHRRARHVLAGAAPSHGERGGALIADEVMSAFGRVGEWFAWQRSRR